MSEQSKLNRMQLDLLQRDRRIRELEERVAELEAALDAQTPQTAPADT